MINAKLDYQCWGVDAKLGYCMQHGRYQARGCAQHEKLAYCMQHGRHHARGCAQHEKQRVRVLHVA